MHSLVEWKARNKEFVLYQSLNWGLSFCLGNQYSNHGCYLGLPTNLWSLEEIRNKLSNNIHSWLIDMIMCHLIFCILICQFLSLFHAWEMPIQGITGDKMLTKAHKNNCILQERFSSLKSLRFYEWQKKKNMPECKVFHVR